jgi:hypothetical protein
MSIVRVGLAETKNFSDGYEAIFGKKKEAEQPKEGQQQQAPAQPACGSKPEAQSEKKD